MSAAHNVLFYRRVGAFSGGNLKVWHYFNHVRQSPNHRAHIYFAKDSLWDERNPWLSMKHEVLESWDSIRPDILFLAGLDWSILDYSERERSSLPIINLIQGVRHAQPGDPRYQFLKHRAIRICVSEEIAMALSETGQVNGPVFVIPNGINLQEFPCVVENSVKDCDLLIAALKQPELGRQLMERLKDSVQRIELLTTAVARPEFLARIARARVTAFLPYPNEGFYLPALEGMALGTIVVCPDCVGNRSFCLPGHNCLRPEFGFETILAAIQKALELSPAEVSRILDNARRTGFDHDLMGERDAFFRILENVDKLWEQKE